MSRNVHAIASVMTPPLVPGRGGLPKIALAAADGARFEIYLHGAQVTSWCPAADDADRLFLSESAHFTSDSAIRGGVPVSFPQFADQGPLPMHGFVRNTSWTVVEAGVAASGAARALLRLADDADTRRMWPHAFACEIEAVAVGRNLTVTLRVANNGIDAFAFTTALHTYFRVRDVRDVAIEGLAGAHYRDKVLRIEDVAENEPTLVVDRPIDRVYRAVPHEVVLREGASALAIAAHGTTDTVIWNPGPGRATPGSDLAPDAYKSFVCIEAAVASAPLTLAPGSAWAGSQTLTAE
jgi:glucose-6-phosphate 1-epimerase